jgi:hypothetical protein
MSDSLQNAQGRDQPVKGERREEPQQQEPVGEKPSQPPRQESVRPFMHPALLQKFLQAGNPETPPHDSRAILAMLFNLALLPP